MGDVNTDSIQVIRGIPFPKSERFVEKNIVDAMDHVARDGDVIIASYPKTGTTWLQYIVLQILSKAQQFPAMDEASRKWVPFLELVGVEALCVGTTPRMYKHHIPYNVVRKNERSKCIYIYRNPEDTAVSFYHFKRNREGEQFMDFGSFFERFLSGSVEYGSYFHHVLSFYEHRDDANLLLVSYENLHANTKEEILRIAKFLGEEHHSHLLQNGEVLDKIIENTSFDSMKKKLPTMVSTQQAVDPEKRKRELAQFFRKGAVGEGKVALTESQRRRLRERAEAVMKDTEILEQWFRI